MFPLKWRLPMPLILLALLAGTLTAQTSEGTPPGQVEQEESVQPGINESWKSEKIDKLIGRLENESREIYVQRKMLAAAVGVKRGAAIADVGAGSGFMAAEFSKVVGDGGKVFAVDINATMMGHVADKARELGYDNIDTVVCDEKSVRLPDDSIDLIFVCDTYHHFEYPRTTLLSIHRALRPGGQLVIVDFHRIPGESSEWILGHVRAGEEVFTKEVVDSGFELINTHYFPELKENYMLRFRKAASKD